MIDVPVLLIFYNRPEVLKITFDVIKKVKPKKLYLAQDGPRHDEDYEKLSKCRNIVSEIDWDCKINTLFQSENLGCGMGPLQAINWVFESEDSAIILEDDCVASESFFTFCEEMLEKYKDDERIFLVSGNNLELITEGCNDSYFFGYSGTNWGWATWKRNWIMMDYYCRWCHDKYLINQLELLIKKESSIKATKEINQVIKTLKRLNNGENISYWDVQWQVQRYLNHQLSIIPSKNLISNIGLGPTSTHATHLNIPSKYHDKPGIINFTYNKRFELDFPLKHPKYMIQNSTYDKKVDLKLYPNIIYRIIYKINVHMRKLWKKKDKNHF